VSVKINKIKNLTFIIFLLTFNSPTYSATPSLKDYKIDNTNQLYAKRDMSYLSKKLGNC